MNAQSSMFPLTTSEDSTNVISSAEFSDGPTPSVSQGGKGQSGPEAVHASPSPWQAQERARLTKGTFGPLFDGLSKSAHLQSSLASKLRDRLDVSGSPEYVLTWKSWAMPVGEPICALRASQRRTSAKDFTGWPTPNAMEGGQTSRSGNRKGEPLMGLQVLAKTLAGWTTPQAHDSHPRGAGNRNNPKGGGADLAWDAQLAGWPTTTTMDHIEREGLRPSRIATNRTGGYIAEVLAGPRQVGPIAPSSNAETERPGASRLNPLFSLWLQGFPPVEWASCAVLETH